MRWGDFREKYGSVGKARAGRFVAAQVEVSERPLESGRGDKLLAICYK